MQLAAILAKRCEPGNNNSNNSVFDWNSVTYFQFWFIGAAYQGLAGRFGHASILAFSGLSRVLSQSAG